jgi:hypothetical protein
MYKIRAKLLNIISILVLIYGFSCRKDRNCPTDSHNVLKVANFSLDDIYHSELNFDSIFNGYYYSEKIMSGSYARHPIRTCWEERIGSSTVYMFFFDADTIESLGWQKVIETNRGLLKRKKVDLAYLQSTNFTIIYP